jgi:predicted O-methyltransferase YrrM
MAAAARKLTDRMPAKSLEHAYRRYISSVSLAAYAISLPLARYVHALAHERRPRRVLDLGSGFSSYVLRRYAAEQDFEVDAWSVDHDPVWLERTQRFLEAEGLPAGQLTTWNERPAGRFDLVLHDLHTVASRLDTLDEALAVVAPGGAIVLDDMDVPDYREHAARVLEQRGIAYIDASEATLDKRGRFSWLVLL